jgi:hypothetical protein
MKSILTAFTAVLVLIGGYWDITTAVAQTALPEQSQASNLAVPDQTSVKYVSALIIDQCRQVGSVIFVTSTGELAPQHIQDLTLAGLLNLLGQIPADKILEVTLPCSTEAHI